MSFNQVGFPRKKKAKDRRSEEVGNGLPLKLKRKPIVSKNVVISRGTYILPNIVLEKFHTYG